MTHKAEALPDSRETECGATLEDAIDLAEFAHRGQVDKSNSQIPYIRHCLRVMRALEPYGEKVQTVGVLHDTIEDTDITPDFLNKTGYSLDIIHGILSVSKSERDSSYADLINRSTTDGLGKLVKLADNLDNSNPERLADNKDADKAEQLKEKYESAREILLEDQSLALEFPRIQQRIHRLYREDLTIYRQYILPVHE